jgi:hypothetical protein
VGLKYQADHRIATEQLGLSGPDAVNGEGFGEVTAHHVAVRCCVATDWPIPLRANTPSGGAGRPCGRPAELALLAPHFTYTRIASAHV